MPGRAERLLQGPKARPRIQMAGRVHAAQGFEIADLVAETARDAHAMPQKKRAHAMTARRAQKIHLAQLAYLERGACERTDSRTPHDLPCGFDDEVRRARRTVGP